MTYCEHCGKELEKDARFCVYCGEEVSVPIEDPSAESQPENGAVQEEAVLLGATTYLDESAELPVPIFGEPQPFESTVIETEADRKDEEAIAETRAEVVAEMADPMTDQTAENGEAEAVDAAAKSDERSAATDTETGLSDEIPDADFAAETQEEEPKIAYMQELQEDTEVIEEPVFTVTPPPSSPDEPSSFEQDTAELDLYATEPVFAQPVPPRSPYAAPRPTPMPPVLPVSRPPDTAYTKTKDYAPHPGAVPVYQAPAESSAQGKASQKLEKPMSTWAYFFLFIVFSIPLIGLLLEIILLASAKNQNRRNFARAALYMRIFCYIFLLIGVVVTLLVVGQFQLPNVYFGY